MIPLTPISFPPCTGIADDTNSLQSAVAFLYFFAQNHIVEAHYKMRLLGNIAKGTSHATVFRIMTKGSPFLNCSHMGIVRKGGGV